MLTEHVIVQEQTTSGQRRIQKLNYVTTRLDKLEAVVGAQAGKTSRPHRPLGIEDVSGVRRAGLTQQFPEVSVATVPVGSRERPSKNTICSVKAEVIRHCAAAEVRVVAAELKRSFCLKGRPEVQALRVAIHRDHQEN